jgi:predicted NAD/FAD-binding protein
MQDRDIAGKGTTGMPFETGGAAPKRIAVIGAGISGLGAAHHAGRRPSPSCCSRRRRRLGGHARTIVAGKRGDQPVDTGFIVFNHVNYPHLTRLFADLDVPVAKSNMSFSASIGGGRLEYALNDLNAIFGQRRNLCRSALLGMLRDIMRFNARAVETAREPGPDDRRADREAGARRPGSGTHYLLPFSGAIWSTPKEGILDFPAHAMVRFFENHALLGYDRPAPVVHRGGRFGGIRPPSRRGAVPARRGHPAGSGGGCGAPDAGGRRGEGAGRGVGGLRRGRLRHPFRPDARHAVGCDRA